MIRKKIRTNIKNLFLSLLFFFALFSKDASAFVVRQINVSGNNNIKNEFILENLGFRVGDNLDKRKLNSSLKKLYNTGSFADVSIDDNGYSVNVSVVEAPLVGNVYITGNDMMKIEDIRKELLTKSMQVYSKNKVKFDTDRLYGIFQKMGYLNISITPKVVFLEGNLVDVIFDIQAGQAKFISQINFYGNEHFSKRKLLGKIEQQERSGINFTDAKGRFEEDKVEKDAKNIEMFYKSQGYANVKVENSIGGFNKADYNFDVNYYIDEGDIYNFGETNIISDFQQFTTDTQIINSISHKQGQRFDILKIIETKYKIENYLKGIGYANVEVNYNISLDDENKIASVDYNFIINQKIYIDKIQIVGNVKTKSQVILREMMIHEGDMYNKASINESKDRIYMLGYFKTVDIEEYFIPDSDLVQLVINVEEQFYGNMMASLGWNNFFGVQIQGSLNIHNFLGRGYRFGITLTRNGYNEGGNIDFYDPYFIKNYNIGLGVSLYVNHFGDLWGKLGTTQYAQYMLYKGYSFGGAINLGFEIFNRLTLDLSVGANGSIYSTMGSSGGYKLYNQLVGTRYAMTFGWGITWNKMNRARYATKGFLLQIHQKFAGLDAIGFQQFMSNTVKAVANIPIFDEDLYLHVSAQAGMVTNLAKKDRVIGFENLFSLGGYMSMRGFNFYGIGPRISQTVNGVTSYMYYATEAMQYYYVSFELRSPLFIPKDYGVYLNAFVDIGSAWGFAGHTKTAEYTASNGTKIKEEVKDTAAVRVSAGIGINWNSPMGEIGFYYAKPIVKKAYDSTLEFGIRMGGNF